MVNIGGKTATAAALLVPLLLVAVSPCPAASSKVRVYGKVVDQHRQPVRHARIILHAGDLKGRVLGTCATGRDGAYEIWHAPASHCALKAEPPEHKGLAETLLPNVNGSADRHLIVTLQPGFEVHGRVVWKGHGLKGVAVRAGSDDDKGVHSGAFAMTDRRGEFQLSLTPGHKHFEVFPSSLSAVAASGDSKAGEGLPSIASGTFTITEDKVLPDIIVPDNAAQLVAR